MSPPLDNVTVFNGQVDCLIRPVHNSFIALDLISENLSLSFSVIDLQILVRGDIILLHKIFYRRSLVPARIISLITTEMNKFRAELWIYLCENLFYRLVRLIQSRVKLSVDRSLTKQSYIRKSLRFSPRVRVCRGVYFRNNPNTSFYSVSNYFLDLLGWIGHFFTKFGICGQIRICLHF